MPTVHPLAEPRFAAGATLEFGWGEAGLRSLAPVADVIVLVDVLTFTTAVSVGVRSGAAMYPYRWRDDRAADYAREAGAHLAGQRGKSRYSLSPASLMGLSAGDKLVLPSPNGATLSLRTDGKPTFAGCLRNAEATARAANMTGRNIAVIASGERWPRDGAFRPALEDQIGAGAILSYLEGTHSADAYATRALFEGCRDDLPSLLLGCPSGHELTQRGYRTDVELASQFNVDDQAARLSDGAYRAVSLTQGNPGDTE